MLDPRTIDDFLAHPPIAVVGASDDGRKFGNTVYRALRDHGLAVIPVNPNAASVAGDPCVPDLAAIDGEIGGVLVMRTGAGATAAVREAAARGVPRVWLFKGLGSPGALNEDALQAAQDADMAVVEGACPLMFLSPVGGAHRVHRALRRLNGSLARSA